MRRFGRRSTSWPAISTWPLAAGTSPMRVLISVDLPQPVGPTTKTNSPRSIPNDTRSSATWPPW